MSLARQLQFCKTGTNKLTLKYFKLTTRKIYGIFQKDIFTREKEKLDTGLQKTKTGVWDKISRAVVSKSKVDDEVLDNLEEAFITSDVGVDTTLKIIERLEARVARDKYLGSEELNNLLCEEVTDLLAEDISRAENQELGDFEVPKTGEPYVIMVVGVNGVGKTTTIGKLVRQYVRAGNKVAPVRQTHSVQPPSSSLRYGANAPECLS